LCRRVTRDSLAQQMDRRLLRYEPSGSYVTWVGFLKMTRRLRNDSQPANSSSDAFGAKATSVTLLRSNNMWNIRNHWVSRLYPSFGILNTRKYVTKEG
jgi:hypothetical protein